MTLANFQSVTKRYGAQTVLQDVSFRIASGEKVGLIGPNGSGKTTILRILMGLEPPSDGNAATARGARLGYVPQHVDYDDDLSVGDCLLMEHRRLTAELREQEQALAEASGDELPKAMRGYQRARDAYDRIDGDTFAQRAEAMLDALGLPGRWEQKVGSLSGGEKNVLAMTEALLEEPDLLLLDEPANHLDYQGVAWLEDFLSRYKGALLIVSHNRYLLDRVVESILHLENAQIEHYQGNYSTYRANRLRKLVAQQEDYIANQKRLAQLEALVQRFADIARGNTDPAWGKRLRARRKQLEREREQAVDKPMVGSSAIKPDFQTEASRADIALQVRDYRKAFGDLLLFDGVDLNIQCGDRVALVGPNGCGKTTLLRDVVEHGAWDHPSIRVGPSLSIGYCAQQQEVLDPDATILDQITSTGRIGKRDAYGILARFLFGYHDADKRVRDLSGGERNRLQLACLMVDRPNFLILDEPTNHLDINAREAVEEALADYEGTILVVSHDRYFLDKVVDRVIEVRDRRLHPYPGGFTAFWYARGRAALRTSGRVAARGKSRKRTRISREERAPSVQALERSISEAEKEKVALEQRIERALARRNRRDARQASRDLEQLETRLEALYEDWIEQSE